MAHQQSGLIPVVQLRALNEAYFSALDRRDFDALGQCFATDTIAEYLGGQWRLKGRAAVVERLRLVATFDGTLHLPGTMSFDGATAAPTGTVFAVASLSVDDGAGTSRVIVRGLRYSDVYVADDGLWRIARRRQDELWQYEMPAVTPAVPGGFDVDQR